MVSDGETESGSGDDVQVISTRNAPQMDIFSHRSVPCIVVKYNLVTMIKSSLAL